METPDSPAGATPASETPTDETPSRVETDAERAARIQRGVETLRWTRMAQLQLDGAAAAEAAKEARRAAPYLRLIEEKLVPALTACAPAKEAGAATTTEEPNPEILSLADWLAKPAPATVWLMESLIAEASIALSIGRPFGGKSLSALNRLLCLAAGVNWLDFKVSDAGVVGLYVDEEMGRPLMESRLLKMRQSNPRFQDTEAAKRFLIASRQGFRLDEKAWQDTIRRLIEEKKVKHVVWDTLRRLHSKNEDRSEEMAPIFAFLSGLRRDFGVSCELIHHTKKNVDEGGNWLDAARGSGDITAAADAVLGTWKAGDGLFSFRADSKLGGEVAPRDLHLDSERLWFGPAPEGAAKEKADEAKIMEAAEKLDATLRRLHGDLSPVKWDVWKVKAGGRWGLLAQARLKLETLGRIRKVKGGWMLAEPEA